MPTLTQCCGFECGIIDPDTGAGSSSHWHSTSGDVSFSTTTVRSTGGGAKSLRVNPTSASATARGSAPASCVHRVYVRFATLPSASTLILYQGNHGVYFNQSDSKLYARDATVSSTTGISVTTGVWYRVELKVNEIGDTVDVQVDGVATTQVSGGLVGDAV